MRAVAGRYRLEQELGRGGMGTVYRAEDPLAGRMVAVKELRAPAGLPDAERELFLKRAMQEARSAARIQHPGVVTLYDVIPPSADDDAMYLVMEYIDGGSFAEEIRHGRPLSLQRVTEVGLQLLSVLAAAHPLGIVHRDIKPANILLTRGGQVKLTDFGIAYTAGDTRLTGMGGVAGTVAYMAPELFETGAITPAADIWALGATLYHAAVGRNPFDRGATAPTLRAILVDPLPDPGCGTALASACTAMLRRDPASRATIDQARALMTGSPGGVNAPTLVGAASATEHSPGAGSPLPTVEVDQQGFLPRLRSAFRNR
jgi:serine/threonine protein kinase